MPSIAPSGVSTNLYPTLTSMLRKVAAFAASVLHVVHSV